MSEIPWSKHKLWTEDMILAERTKIDEAQYGKWGLAIEQEIRRRIRICVASYAYEICNDEIMPDSEWDRIAQEINPRLGTCHPIVDEFFATEFSPMTGMWIHKHPELAGIKRLYEMRRR